MPRPLSDEIRRTLIDAAATMLARRQAVTLRGLASAAGVSTMAIYTYFDGMDGLWGAVRQEGFTRLAARLGDVRTSRDPVRHLADLGVAYVDNALTNPDLYRVMFESAFELPDPSAADGSFTPLITTVQDARAAERFDASVDAADVATRFWASGHGITSLAVSGVLPVGDVARHAEAVNVAIFVAAGDDRARARRSASAAWRGWSR